MPNPRAEELRKNLTMDCPVIGECPHCRDIDELASLATDSHAQAIAQAAECPYTLPLLVVGVSHINAEDFGMSQRDMANRIEREVICEENKNDEFDCYELQDSKGVFISIVESKEGLPRLYWLSQLACAGVFHNAKIHNKALDEVKNMCREFFENAMNNPEFKLEGTFFDYLNKLRKAES